MQLLATPFSLLEIVIFSLAVIAFILAVRFFIASQKRLENLLPQTKQKKSAFSVGLDRDGFIVPAGKEPVKKNPANTYPPFAANDETRSEIKELRGMLQLQQLELERAINQITEIKSETKVKDDFEGYESEEETLYKEKLTLPPGNEAEELRYQLQKKEAELQEMRQQAQVTQKLQEHFEEVQAGYQELQLKVQKMEQQAWQAAELSVKIESLEQQNEHLEKDAVKNKEKIQELTLENNRVQALLAETGDQLSEANLQRQHLKKKVHFLEEINNDIQQMSDANRKLKNELRRVAELESMLNLITQERDTLLYRRTVRL